MVSNLSSKGVDEPKSSRQPWLLITGRRENCILTNMSNNKPQLLYDVGGEIPEFLGRNVACSFGEWVLLTVIVTGTGHNLPEVLVNLLSKEIIELPSLDITPDLCILTSHPYDPNCRIVYFDKDENAVMFCQPGDKEFTIKKWDYEFFPTRPLAAVAGKLFLSIRYITVGVIEFKESTYTFEVVEMASEIELTSFSNFVYCEYSGELYAIYRTNDCVYLTGFEILKADFLNKRWVGVKNLGTLAIFIGDRTAHVQCASVESGIKANSIHLLEHDGFHSYYIYNLEDGTIRMKPILSSMEIETTKLATLDWIMMHCDETELLKGDQESICHDSEEEKKASGEVEEVGLQNSWNMVPPELLNLIQLNLFGRDNAVFRVVCKAWQQVSIRECSIPSIPQSLSSTTLLEELCQSSPPLLMFQEDITISSDSVPIFRFFDPVHKKLYRTGMPDLRGTDIQCSKDGWLLVSRRIDESIFFFNPLTREKIELPGMPVDSIFYAYPYTLSFSSPPTCSNCIVVGIVDCLMFYTLKHGEERWREQEICGYRSGCVDSPGCPVMLNGLHHFMFNNREMLAINLKVGKFHYRPWPTKFKRPELRVQHYFLEDFLLEIDGALAFVSVEPDGGEMSIFKWNDLETDWELMEGCVDFAGKEMFLSRRGSFMEKIDDGGGMGNTIFLPMIDDDAKEGVFYSLDTRKYHTFYSGYSSELPYNADKFLNGIWVKPDRTIVGDDNLMWFL